MVELSKVSFNKDIAPPVESEAPCQNRTRLLSSWKLGLGTQFADIFIINVTALVSYFIARGSWGYVPLRYALVFVGTSFLCQVSFIQAQVYSLPALSDPIRALRGIVPRWSFIFLMLATTAALTHEPALFSRLWFGLFYIGGIINLLITRISIDRRIRHLVRAGYYTSSVVLIGYNEISAALIARLSTGFSGIHFAAVFDDQAVSKLGSIGNVPMCGGVDDLILYAKTHQVDLVVVTLPIAESARLMALLRQLQHEPLTIRVLPGALGMQRISPIRLSRHELPGIHLIPLADRPIPEISFFVKTMFDRIIALVGLVVLAPVLLICATAIAIYDPGPVLFLQPRVGFKGQIFNIIKFRTMHRSQNVAQCPTERADARVFKVGGWLRKLSLDELPQLINVLRGDMSLVGPRPHMVGQRVNGQYFADVVNEYSGRHWVKPGMTGWAQVNGWRGPAATLEQIERRVEHDIYYIENWSITFDLIILAKTIFVGFIGKNVF